MLNEWYGLEMSVWPRLVVKYEERTADIYISLPLDEAHRHTVVGISSALDIPTVDQPARLRKKSSKQPCSAMRFEKEP